MTLSTNVPDAIGSGQSLSCDGADDYMAVPLTGLDFAGDLPFSVSAFLYSSNMKSVKICGNYWSANGNAWDFRTDSAGKLTCIFFDVSEDAYRGRRYSTSLTSYDGTWIHVAFTYDGTKAFSGMKLYLNGSQVDDLNLNSVGDTYDGMESVGQIEMGRSISSYGEQLIDDLRIYTDVLTVGEVEYLKTYGVSGDDPTSAALEAHWNFDLGYTDATGNGHDGAFFGSDSVASSYKDAMEADAFNAWSFASGGWRGRGIGGTGGGFIFLENVVAARPKTSMTAKRPKTSITSVLD